MRVTSVFADGEAIPVEYSCDGENVSPPLNIIDVPEDTISLALVVDDPDAQTKAAFTHYVLWNIPPNIRHIEADSIPEDTIAGLNDFDKNAYGGPCPPSGTHRYFFKVYALDTKIGLDGASRKEDLERAMQDHIIEEAMLMGTYTKMVDAEEVEEIDEEELEDEEED
jgi:Raf kinase inhibitor-like YbhB/YbcL family protein